MRVWRSLELSFPRCPQRAQPPSEEVCTPASPRQGGAFLTQTRKRSYPSRSTCPRIPPTQLPTDLLRHAKSVPAVQGRCEPGVVPLRSPVPCPAQPSTSGHMFANSTVT